MPAARARVIEPLLGRDYAPLLAREIVTVSREQRYAALDRRGRMEQRASHTDE